MNTMCKKARNHPIERWDAYKQTNKHSSEELCGAVAVCTTNINTHRLFYSIEMVVTVLVLLLLSFFADCIRENLLQSVWQAIQDFSVRIEPSYRTKATTNSSLLHFVFSRFLKPTAILYKLVSTCPFSKSSLLQWRSIFSILLYNKKNISRIKIGTLFVLFTTLKI